MSSPPRTLAAQHAPSSIADDLRAAAAAADALGIKSGDVYGAGGPSERLEATLAALLGKEAAAFVTTGTAANQACVRAALETRASSHAATVCLHPTSHLVHLDCLRDGDQQSSAGKLQEAAAMNLLGLQPRFMGNFAAVLAVADVEAALAGPVPPAVVVVELPQRMNGGASPSWDELQQISDLCRRRHVHLHMDGARLWEAAPKYGAGSLPKLAQLFDSVYVSFYKGLGAMTGAAALGSAGFVGRARRWAKALGSIPFCSAANALSCLGQLEALGHDFSPRMERLEALYGLLASLEKEAKGRLRFDPPLKPHSNMSHVYLRTTTKTATKTAMADRDDAAEAKGGGDDGAVDTVAAILEEAHRRTTAKTGLQLWNRLRGSGHSRAHGHGGHERYFEWTVGPLNAAVDDTAVREGWTTFFGELDQLDQQA